MLCSGVHPLSLTTHIPSPPLSYHPFPLEVGALILVSLGNAVSSPSWSGQRPAAKRYVVHCRNSVSGESNFEGTFTKNVFVINLFTSNITWGGIISKVS